MKLVRDRLKDFYSPPGRPSIDPEVLPRLLFVGYLYGFTGERRLLEDVRVPHPVPSTPEGEVTVWPPRRSSILASLCDRVPRATIVTPPARRPAQPLACDA